MSVIKASMMQRLLRVMCDAEGALIETRRYTAAFELSAVRDALIEIAVTDAEVETTQPMAAE